MKAVVYVALELGTYEPGHVADVLMRLKIPIFDIFRTGGDRAGRAFIVVGDFGEASLAELQSRVALLEVVTCAHCQQRNRVDHSRGPARCGRCKGGLS